MANLIRTNVGYYLNHIGAANSFFTGNTLGEIGNIASQTQFDNLRNLYTAGVAWNGAVDTGNIPTAATNASVYVDVQSLTGSPNVGASYECRRGASLITSSGKAQLAISANNGYPLSGANDARICIYYPSEDFNMEVISIEYQTTDPDLPAAGNNQTKLLELTGRMTHFNANNGPNCNGIAFNDLFNTTSIFYLGCCVTWETGNTGGNALILATEP